MAFTMALLGVIGLLVLTVSGDSIGDDSDLFTLALTLQSSVNVDIGEIAFNQMFWDSPQHILKRECSSCGSTHRVIYYKRYTDLGSFNLYKYTYDWESTDNVLGNDFNLFSTLEDALANTNPWTYCNYDDHDIGMFRDCGPTGGHGGEWTSRTRGGDSASFYIYTGPVPNDLFLLGDTSSDWDGAMDWCQQRGYELASIYDDRENSAAAQLGQDVDQDMWIGGLRSDSNPAQWEWLDGTEWGYTNWNSAAGEPNNQNEGCLQLYQSALWNDLSCGNNHRPLCRNKLFVVGSDPMNWTDANEWCQDQGYVLASIHSAEENELATHVIAELGESAWIGGVDSGDNNKWEWFSGLDWGYTNWYQPSFEPSHDHEKCVQLYPGGYDIPNRAYRKGFWNDNTCSKPFLPLCRTVPFVMGNDPMSWEEANEWCRDQGEGFELASIHSAEENGLAVYATGGEHVWIGGMNPSGDNVNWEWSYGAAWDYTNWFAASDEPSHDDEKCVQLYGTPNEGFWNDNTCTEEFRPLCRIELAPTPSPTASPSRAPSAAPTDNPIPAPAPATTLLEKLEPFQPSEGNIIGYVDVQHTMRIEMDIVVHSIPTGWASIFRIGESDLKRWPGVYLRPTGGLYVAWRYSGSPDDFKAALGGALVIDDTYHLDIEYDQTTFTVTINGELVWNVAKETHTLEQSAPCYSSDGDLLAPDVTISNLVVRSELAPELFVVGSDRMSWDEANEWCQDQGYPLASIHSAEENALATYVLSDGPNGWIGGTNPSGDNVNWEWSSGLEWGYTNWYQPNNEPNGINEQCVMLYSAGEKQGGWNDGQCSQGFRPLCRAELAPTPSSAHLVVQGRTSWGGWGSAADWYCQDNDDNQAAYTSGSRNIGVGCCSMDGNTGYRPSCKKPATYQEAVDLCSSTVKNGESLRLCTRQEMLYGKSNGKGITEGTGCGFDAAYQWVSDECNIETDAAISAGFSDATVSGDETRTFDDFLPMVLGAAVVTALVASIVAMVLVMRKRKSVAKVTGHGMGGAVHVPDASAMSVGALNVVPVIEETANTEQVDEVEVVTAAKQDGGAVTAVAAE